MPPVTRIILALCVLLFIADLIAPAGVMDALALYPLDLQHHLPEEYRFKFWQPVTYAFMHGGIGHLLLNMMVLVMFGSALENYWGSRRYLIFYALCGLGAAAVQLAASEYALDHGSQVAAVVGASGALFGLLVGYGMHFPDHRVMLLIPPIPMKARTLVILIGVAETVFGFMGWLPGIAHFAHLGGLLTGLVLVKLWLKPRRALPVLR